ncbi:YceI family protein [Chthoniobacter flavus Ellin428]|uniref:YceI family protein n=1 Tax=Chthoniobacter flavus Ellin428 TaxID=497964 RepID=B4D7W7_9BACT|nr:YceI family protein [Chthoniobacter flavus]EDY17490.1 YceI family protein [Chthoniobacter flavus Ellin428]TCO92286.1 polyisoprenoid-binding protein YceI [Chthoniobacter flavus]
MTALELQTRIQTPQPPALLHVLPPEVFAAVHIPHSLNACVYETAFLDKVHALALDPAAPLVVYGAGEGSLDAIAAAEKLRAAGFTHVETFGGGITAWQAAGLPFEGTGHLPEPPIPHGTYRVDPAESVIRWTGRNLFNHHSGTVRLALGEIRVRQGELTGARFTIDMTSIACEDLTDRSMNAMLLAHLRTTDFFDTEHHPTAEFIADTAEQIPAWTDGTPNYQLRGTFTLRGISHPMAFPVLIAAKDDARHLTGQGVLTFDRTAYGSQYGSGKLFRFLGPHVVNDHIHLHVKIHAERMA